MNRVLLIPVVILLLVVSISSAALAGPLDGLFSGARIDADPNKDYVLTEDHGPWLVMACTFSGPPAYEQARELVIELRRKYKMPAYLYSKTFKFSVGDDGRGVDQFGGRLPLKYQRGDETTEIAVLVGDFPSVDDEQAQKTLEKIKVSTPECLELDGKRPTARNLASWRLFFSMAHDVDKKKGPMWKAFMVANPLLPQEYFAPRGLEKFVVDMNQDSPYSLLKCPGNYTVQVAHFTGRVEIDPKKVQSILDGAELGNTLDEAGEKAETLTKALRLKGYEAYEFHDRCASIVTVGSFESVGTPLADGKVEINPEVLRIMRVFGAANTGPLPGQPQGAMQPKVLANIPFDVQPIPVEVPKASISSVYNATFLK